MYSKQRHEEEQIRHKQRIAEREQLKLEKERAKELEEELYMQKYEKKNKNKAISN